MLSSGASTSSARRVGIFGMPSLTNSTNAKRLPLNGKSDRARFAQKTGSYKRSRRSTGSEHLVNYHDMECASAPDRTGTITLQCARDVEFSANIGADINRASLMLLYEQPSELLGSLTRVYVEAQLL
jgi:hypothetical protein